MEGIWFNYEVFFWSAATINLSTAIVFIIGACYRFKELEDIGRV